MPRNFSALATPRSVTETVLVLLVELEVEVGDVVLLGAGVEAVGLLARLHHGRELGELLVEVGRLLGRAGDDQRRARLVDEDVVDLVDDAEGVAALDLLLQRVAMLSRR